MWPYNYKITSYTLITQAYTIFRPEGLMIISDTFFNADYKSVSITSHSRDIRAQSLENYHFTRRGSIFTNDHQTFRAKKIVYFVGL